MPDPAPTQPAAAAAPAIVFHSWADAKRPQQINAMTWITGAHEPPAIVAAGASRTLLVKPPQRRVLLIVPAIVETWAGDPVKLVGQGPNTANHVRWFTSFYEELNRRGVRPEFIATDEEFNFATFSLLKDAKTVEERTAIMRRFYNDPLVRQKMPPQVAALTPEDYSKGHYFAPSKDSPQNTWNDWAAEVIFRLIDEAVFAPARKVWPGFDRFSNYGDVVVAFTATDEHGWPVHPVKTGGVASPSLYLIPGLAHNDRKKHRFWNVLISVLTLSRANVASGARVVPWVSYPSYCAPNKDVKSMHWLWSTMMDHLLASGLGEFLYWNPVPDTTHPDNALVADIADKRRPAAQAPKDLPPIDGDADQITTGQITTTYEQFTANFKSL